MKTQVFWGVNTASLDEQYRRFQNSYWLQFQVGRDSSVGIANRYGLDGPVMESRWGRGFPHPSRPAWGPPSPLYNGYRVCPGGKAAGAWRWLPTPSSAEVKERAELRIYSSSWPSWPVLGWTLPSASRVMGWLLDPWRWRHHEPPKRRRTFTQRKIVGSQTPEPSATPQRQPRFL